MSQNILFQKAYIIDPFKAVMKNGIINFVDIERDRPGKGDLQLLETYLYVSDYKIRYNKHQKPAVRTNNRAETLIK